MITLSENQQKIVDALEAIPDNIKSEGYMRGVNDDRKLWEHRIEQIRAEIKQMDTLITRSEVLEVIDKYLD